MLVLRVACELGKYPDDVAARLNDPEQLLEWAAYFSYLNGEPQKKELSVEDTLINTLGKPT